MALLDASDHGQKMFRTGVACPARDATPAWGMHNTVPSPKSAAKAYFMKKSVGPRNV
jgi:hypothetical protein